MNTIWLSSFRPILSLKTFAILWWQNAWWILTGHTGGAKPCLWVEAIILPPVYQLITAFVILRCQGGMPDESGHSWLCLGWPSLPDLELTNGQSVSGQQGAASALRMLFFVIASINFWCWQCFIIILDLRIKDSIVNDHTEEGCFKTVGFLFCQC